MQIGPPANGRRVSSLAGPDLQPVLQDQEPGPPRYGLQAAVAVQFEGASGDGVADVAADRLQHTGGVANDEIAMQVGARQDRGGRVLVDGAPRRRPGSADVSKNDYGIDATLTYSFR